jgi:hypothetical protein
MGERSSVLDDTGLHLEGQTTSSATGMRLEPILDEEGGRGEAILVESFLERVIIVTLKHDALALSDINAIRRAMIRAQACRAVLSVPPEATISNPVMLLATLSKIQVQRRAPMDAHP